MSPRRCAECTQVTEPADCPLAPALREEDRPAQWLVSCCYPGAVLLGSVPLSLGDLLCLLPYKFQPVGFQIHRQWDPCRQQEVHESSVIARNKL